MAQLSKMIHQYLYQLCILVLLLTIRPTEYVVLQSQSTDDDLWRNILQDTYKAGPYNKYCNRTEPIEERPPDPMGEFYPCQLECSCDPFSCDSTLPCCPDIPEKNVTARNTSCLYPVMYKGPYNSFKDPRRYVDFPIRMVHDCNDVNIGSELHEKCLSYHSTKDLDFMLPVISNATGIVYVNRFCAACSDEMNFTVFESYFVCMNDLLFLSNWEDLALERTFENQLFLIEKGSCVFAFKLSDGRQLENNKCLPVHYNSCNQSGMWDIYDQYIEDACSAYELPYEHRAGVVYRNYHCYVCNARQTWRAGPLCMKDSQFVLRISFYALMNLDQTDIIGIDMRNTENDQLLCGDDSIDVFDKYLNKCRRPHCPVFHVRRNDTCIPAYSGFDIEQKEATLLFEEVNSTEKMHDPYVNFTTNVLPIMQKEIIKELLNVTTLTSLKVFQKEGNNSCHSDFILTYRWSSTADQQLVPRTVERFFKPVLVNINFLYTSGYFMARLITKHKEYHFHDMLKYEFQENNYSSIYVNLHFDSTIPFLGRFRAGVLYMSRLLVCNRVTVSLSEFNQSDDAMTLDTGDVIQLTQAYIVTETQIHLCQDEYITRSPENVFEKHDKPLVEDVVVVLSFVCSLISMVCLLLTAVTYALLKSLRTVPGKINACLSVSLLIAQVLQQFTMDLVEYPIACVVFGALIHFSWSITLFWMNISSFNLFRIFSPRNVGHEVKPSLGVYSIYVVGMSCLLVAANIAYSHFSSVDGNLGYGHAGQHVCYILTVNGLLITFVAPVGVIILSNIVFLVVTIWRISRTQMPEGSHSNDRNNVLIYLKMSTLTGCCWLFGFIRIWTGEYVFEILFILTNASQGLLLMLSFVCNRRVIGLLRERFSRVQNRQ